MMYFELQFRLWAYSKAAVQLYFPCDPFMTLGQLPTFRGQNTVLEVTPDLDESFGVIYSAVALLGSHNVLCRIR